MASGPRHSPSRARSTCRTPPRAGRKPGEQRPSSAAVLSITPTAGSRRPAPATLLPGILGRRRIVGIPPEAVSRARRVSAASIRPPMWRTPISRTRPGRPGGRCFSHRQSVVYHKHRATSARRFSPQGVQCLIQRNQLFFIWKNIRSWRLLLSHCFFLPWNCYRIARDHGLGSWKCLAGAVAHFPAVQIARFGSRCQGRTHGPGDLRALRKPGIILLKAAPEPAPADTREQRSAARTQPRQDRGSSGSRPTCRTSDGTPGRAACTSC